MTASPSSPDAKAAGAAARPVLRIIARLIATDRRAAVLASETGNVLLANSPAQRLHLDDGNLCDRLDWAGLCRQAQRAGSVPASLSLGSSDLEGEVVHIPLGGGNGYLLRLSENDHEATWLRNRARAATLMRVAHDLRTPIQSLLASAENVLDGTDTGDKAAQREQLQQSAGLALEHISNVLGVIRGEQSVAGLRPDETFNITEELRSLLTMIAPIALKRQVGLTLRIDPPGDIWVHGPVRFVRALFQNMIDNSVKHGGDAVDITLACRPLPSPADQSDQLAITLAVSDRGGGLPPEQKERVFNALGQPDSPQQGKAPLSNARPSAGLNVLAHALRQLGGKLELDDIAAEDSKSRPHGKTETIGTAMRAILTLQKGESPRRAPLPQGPDKTAPPPLQGLSILLVEDSPSSRDWLQHMMENAGAKVWTAGNGIEALSLLERPGLADALDLILTDLTLPYMSGIDLAQRVRQQAQHPGKPAWSGPIVGLTAHVAAPVLAACREAGIVPVLEKPIRPEELRQALREIMRPQVPPENPASNEVPPPPAKAQDTQGILKPGVVDELLSQLGRDGAISFMQRARNEAAQVLTTLAADGIGPDTRRMLHAATGACSLTGLGEIETCLRATEQAVEAGETDLGQFQANLEAALRRTQEAIQELL